MSTSCADVARVPASGLIRALISIRGVFREDLTLRGRCGACSACHEFANACAPSGCNRAASAAKSMPARAKRANIASASPPAGAIGPCTTAVFGEGAQGLFRQRVDGVGRGQGFDVEGVGGARVLRAGAGPEQPLRMRASFREPLQARRLE